MSETNGNGHREGVDPARPCGGPKGWYSKDGTLRGSEQPMPGRCGRHLRGTDPPRYCRNRVVAGRGSCKYHGGHNPVGAAHPSFQHGKRSVLLKRLPQDLKGAAAAAERLARKRSLQEDLDVLAVRLVSLVDSLGDPPPWGAAAEAFAVLDAALRAPDEGRRAAAFRALGAVLRDGAARAEAQRQTWAEIREVIQERTRTAAAEWRRQVEAKSLVTVEQALMLWQALMQAAKEVVTDKAVYRKLTERTLQLLPPPE